MSIPIEGHIDRLLGDRGLVAAPYRSFYRWTRLVFLAMPQFVLDPIALGCMSLPLHDEALCFRILEEAVDRGIGLFDTADFYSMGRNEELIGRFLRSRSPKVRIATKVGNEWRSDGSGWDWNPRKDYIIRAVKESLRRLGIERIDLYQLHGGTIEDPIDETVDALETLKREGVILHYGISSIRPNLVREYIARSSIETLMCQYGAADRRPEESILPMIREKGVRLLARGVLARGLLCGKEPAFFQGHSAETIGKGAAAVLECSSRLRTPVHTAIRFVLQSHADTTVVIGVSNLCQLAEMADAVHAPPLTDEEYRLISSSLPALRYTEHR